MYSKIAALSSVKRENQFMSYKTKASNSSNNNEDLSYSQDIKPFKVPSRSSSRSNSIANQLPRRYSRVNLDSVVQTIREDNGTDIAESTRIEDPILCENVRQSRSNDSNICLRAVCCPPFKDLLSKPEPNTNNILNQFSARGKVTMATVEHASISSSMQNLNCCQKRSCYFHRWKHFAIEPSSSAHYAWLVVISMAILYNIVMVVARAVFTQLATDYTTVWYVMDYFCDALYLIDMVVRFKTGYLENGLTVKHGKKLAYNYIESTEFKFDVFSILPSDFFYLVTNYNPMVRINRLFRWQRLLEFFDRTIRRTNYPNVFRILNLVLYILIIVHWNACFYFAISNVIGFGSDNWVYPNSTSDPAVDKLSRKYIYSFYWSTLTLLTIGETPHPERDVEYVFVVCDFLVGVLIFATIVGNVGSMITNMNHDRSIFTQKLDGVKRYMKIRKVNQNLQQKVINWFDYLWTHKESLDDDDCMMALPENLRAEIAMHVHLKVLNQLSIFKDCELGLLAELVLKLKLQVFSPGDYICKKGDIGREMYIVKQGMLTVCGDDGSIYKTLTQGDVCGELSILEIPGSKKGNRRIADVISIGYSDCLILSKSDLWGLLKDYPVARQRLYDRGRDMLTLADELHAFDYSDQESLISTPEAGMTNLTNTRIQCIEDQLGLLEDRVSYFSSSSGSEMELLKAKVKHIEQLLASKFDYKSTSTISTRTPMIHTPAQTHSHQDTSMSVTHLKSVKSTNNCSIPQPNGIIPRRMSLSVENLELDLSELQPLQTNMPAGSSHDSQTVFSITPAQTTFQQEVPKS